MLRQKPIDKTGMAPGKHHKHRFYSGANFRITYYEHLRVISIWFRYPGLPAGDLLLFATEEPASVIGQQLERWFCRIGIPRLDDFIPWG